MATNDDRVYKVQVYPLENGLARVWVKVVADDGRILSGVSGKISKADVGAKTLDLLQHCLADQASVREDVQEDKRKK